ncbi:hypothetical protein CYMTET_33757 [Cymbomonas tetramitiformis]|uniref:TsaA-like domain-containing protein n=1 Tax=Cymbomonas tetramitiformis TaxID=36881 RepID=A0AAE0KQM4_9CHLO|nr:hypothetical protein CYMTET_33757 [Cymbomonas tetramitiformis]
METSGLDNEPKDGVLQLFPDLVPPEALRDLDGFDYLWCIFFCHLNAMNMDSSSGVNTGWNAMVRPPRPRNAKKLGLFATRAPHRPNPLGLSALKILSVDAPARQIHVRGLDLLDGTPILDIKPYVRAYDAMPEARAGWLEALEEGSEK